MHTYRNQSLGVRGMDRLPLVGCLILALACLPSCENKGKSKTKSGRERVESVANTQSAAEIAAEFCDAVPDKPFAPPALVDDKKLANSNGWHWINLWATWCKPCIEEMPRLLSWQRKWQATGLNLKLSFVSVDQDPEAVDSFAKAHPEIPSTLRVADLEELKSWLLSLGASEMIVPVQILVDGLGKVRCIRTSSVEDRDERLVKSLLQASP